MQHLCACIFFTQRFHAIGDFLYTGGAQEAWARTKATKKPNTYRQLALRCISLVEMEGLKRFFSSFRGNSAVILGYYWSYNAPFAACTVKSVSTEDELPPNQHPTCQSEPDWSWSVPSWRPWKDAKGKWRGLPRSGARPVAPRTPRRTQRSCFAGLSEIGVGFTNAWNVAWSPLGRPKMRRLHRLTNTQALSWQEKEDGWKRQAS